MCAFDYQLYSDTRRIREKMSLVCVSTHDKTFFVRSFVRTYVRWLVGWMLGWFVGWLLLIVVVLWVPKRKRAETNLVRFGLFVCVCVYVYEAIRAGVEADAVVRSKETERKRKRATESKHWKFCAVLSFSHRIPSHFHSYVFSSHLSVICLPHYILTNKRFSSVSRLSVFVLSFVSKHTYGCVYACAYTVYPTLWVFVCAFKLVCVCVEWLFQLNMYYLFSFHSQYWKSKNNSDTCWGNI